MRRPATAPAADKAAQLDKFYADYWEALLKLNPLQATFQGDNRYNDQMPDFYSAGIPQTVATSPGNGWTRRRRSAATGCRART